MLKGENRNITYDHEQASTLSKSLPSLSSEQKKIAIWGYKSDNWGTDHHHEHGDATDIDDKTEKKIVNFSFFLVFLIK